MECCQADGIEELMGPRMASGDLRRYRRRGPDKTTRRLLDAIIGEGVEGKNLLDIGGGVGVLQHELLKAGVKEAASVDASSAYLKAAQDEAKSQGHPDQIKQFHGDFVELAGEITNADIVTLNRVICCYDDMEKLVELSAQKAEMIYGVVYPPDHWLLKTLVRLEDLNHRIKRSQFRTFVHPTAAVEALIQDAGFERYYSHDNLFWQIHVYRRPSI